MEDSLSLYMKQITDITKKGFLSREEEAELAMKAQQGDENARNKLVEMNTRLVVHIAWEYAKSNVPIEDLVQEGNLALLHAVALFKPEKGYRFTTYATKSIKQRIGRYIENQGGSLRLSAYRNETISKIKKYEQQLLCSLNRMPTVSELAEATDFSIEKVENALSYLASTETVSLDAPMTSTSQPLATLIPDKDLNNPEKQVLHSAIRQDLLRVLNTLSRRERELLLLSFGFVDGEVKGLKDLAVHFGLSRERCRQIKQGALLKLQKHLDLESYREANN